MDMWTGLMPDCDNSGSFCAEKEQRGCSSGMVTEDLISDGPWSQRSISRSLQRAETLLRSTFNPSLKWLFQCHGQDEKEEEGNFVAAHNLVSRSSARLLRLQQALLTLSPQWQVLGGFFPQAHVKGLTTEGGVLLLSSLSALQGNYGVLWKLLKQRSLLLFIHEYTRRARLSAAYISRLTHLLEYQQKKSPQSPSSWSSLRVSLGSLSQELRVHLNHWSCLCSKVQSDHHLRAALVQRTRMLVEIKQSLDLLGLHALLLMERYVCVVLSALAQTEFDSVPREVLEDILAGTDLYNQAVCERAQHSTTSLKTAVLQQAYCSTRNSSLPNSKGHHPTAISVRELMTILATHHADMAAMQLHHWASNQSYEICHVHTNYKANASSDHTSPMRSEWTAEELQFTCQTSHKTPPVYISDCNVDSTLLENHHPELGKPTLVPHLTEFSDKGQTSHNDVCQILPAESSMDASISGQQHIERQNTNQLETISPSSATFHSSSALLLSGLCQQNYSSAELLFKQPFSSTDLLFPLASHIPAPEGEQLLLLNTVTDGLSAKGKIAELVELNTALSKKQQEEGPQQELAEVEMTAKPEDMFRGQEKEETEEVEETTTLEHHCLHWPHSVQWSDQGQSLVFDDLFRQYGTLLWTLCRRALWMQLHVPQAGRNALSVNLQDSHRVFQVLLQISQGSDLLPNECRAMLEDLRLRLLAVRAYAQWDYVTCKSLGSALKDKCLNSVKTSSERDRGGKMSATTTHFQMLPPALLSSLHQSNSTSSGSRFKLQRHTVSLALATVQLMTVWVMSKAYQFLSSWSLSSFLLITQGDLTVLKNSLEMMLHYTTSLIMNPNSDLSSLCNHKQLLLREQLKALEGAITKLQTFSSLVLKTFSSVCKRMSGELFEQTMPSATYWHTNLKTGFPSSASQYASLAAQTVIGQVLEGVAPLPDDARVQALSITMTAFMEAWMEHILKQKIKFSVQGALQLKQDFDSIRELIQSDRYGLSAELHQRLLSLRVFQQVDSAVVCLLQQPQAKPYLPSRAWEPLTQCCPSKSSRDSIDAVVGCSITNLRGVEGEDPTQSDASIITTDLPPMDPSNPGEPYLAPSLVLGTSQQEWLDLRIHSSARRWRLPGLRCFSKSEP